MTLATAVRSDASPATSARPPAPDAYRDFALVVPAYDEAPNVPRLVRELRSAFEEHGLSGEILLVDDGSADGTGDLAETEAAGWDRLRVLRHPFNRGKTEALLTAAEATDKTYLVLFDADLQHLPKEVPRFLDKLEEGWDIVTGRKVGAYDKRVVSSAYNAVSRKMFRVPVSDLNSMKAFRADVLKAVRLRHDWHRFFVVAAHAKGYRATEIDIDLHRRNAGKSKYSGFFRIVGGVLDLLAVWFQLKVSNRPLVAFGVPGLVLTAATGLAGAVALYGRFVAGQGFRPLLYLVMLLATLSAFCFLAGFLAEMIAALREEVEALRKSRSGVDLRPRSDQSRPGSDKSRPRSDKSRPGRTSRAPARQGRGLPLGRGALGSASAHMRSPKLLSVIGTRPEAIKMAPVIRAIEDRGGAEQRVVLTGQHTEMVDQVLSAFAIEPHYDLEIMKPGQSLHDVGRACLDGLKDVAADFRPDATIVQGDTATVFFASVAAFFERSGLAHVEAGLRSGEKWSPFPEEMLRRMTDVLADYCFAPTPDAARNLKREGVPADRVFVTGNTVVDALRDMRARHRRVEDPLAARLVACSPSRRLVLLTAHRRESFGAPLKAVFEAIKALASRFDDIEVLCPVHPNPQVRAPAEAVLRGVERVHLTNPLSYGDLLTVLDRASLVLTDSGGIQEEAPAFGTHALVLREVTERPEGVRAGATTLVGTDPARILAEASRRLARPGDGPSLVSNPYGDGRAGERIADILLAGLAGTPRETEDWASH